MVKAVVGELGLLLVSMEVVLVVVLVSKRLHYRLSFAEKDPRACSQLLPVVVGVVLCFVLHPLVQHSWFAQDTI